MNANRSENHPWMKTFTVMSIIYMVVQVLAPILSGTPGWEAVLLFLFGSVWAYTGIFIIHETKWYSNWAEWSQRHRAGQWLVYYYMAPGAMITFFFLAIPVVIINGLKQSFRDMT